MLGQRTNHLPSPTVARATPAIEVTLSDKSTLIIGSVYRHPQHNFHKFSQAFSNNLLKLKPKKRFVVFGDFNIDYNRYTTDTSAKMFANKITDFGCNQLITLPTRVCENRQSILDHIYLDNSMMNNVVTTAVITESLSDHFPILIQLNHKINKKDENRPLIRLIKPHLIEGFVEELNSSLQNLHTLHITELFNCLSKLTNKQFPKIKLSRKQYKFAKKTWITQDLLKSIKHQNKLYINYQKSGKNSDFKTYKAYRNKVTRQKETAKALYF